MPADRPSWLTEPCPSWCCGNHEGQQFPADRQHQSPQRWRPAVVLERHHDHQGAIVHVASATDFCVVAVRFVNEGDTWVAIATETRQLEFSFESAKRLHSELTELLQRMA